MTLVSEVGPTGLGMTALRGSMDPGPFCVDVFSLVLFLRVSFPTKTHHRGGILFGSHRDLVGVELVWKQSSLVFFRAQKKGPHYKLLLQTLSGRTRKRVERNLFRSVG